jgi:hypothetical protein
MEISIKEFKSNILNHCHAVFRDIKKDATTDIKEYIDDGYYEMCQQLLETIKTYDANFIKLDEMLGKINDIDYIIQEIVCTEDYFVTYFGESIIELMSVGTGNRITLAE